MPIFDARVAEHRVGLTCSRLPVHEHCAVDAAEGAHDDLGACGIVYLRILLTMIETAIYTLQQDMNKTAGILLLTEGVHASCEVRRLTVAGELRGNLVGCLLWSLA